MAPKSSTSIDHDPPIQGWEISSWGQPKLTPVLILRETAFKYKVRRYQRVYGINQPSSYEFTRVPTYVDKTYIVLSYEAGALRICSNLERNIDSYKRRLAQLQQEQSTWEKALKSPPPFPTEDASAPA